MNNAPIGLTSRNCSDPWEHHASRLHLWSYDQLVVCVCHPLAVAIRKAGISSNYCNGRRRPRVNTGRRFSDFYGQDPSATLSPTGIEASELSGIRFTLPQR